MTERSFQFSFPRWLAAAGLTLAVLNASAATSVHLLGDRAGPAEGTRQIALTPADVSVDVRFGEVVRFVVADREFSFRFNGVRPVMSFDLRTVAPAGLLTHEVVAHVSPIVSEFGSKPGRGR